MVMKNKKRFTKKGGTYLLGLLVIVCLSVAIVEAGNCKLCNDSTSCPSAYMPGTCLSGGACSVGNYHKNYQIRSTYPICGSSNDPDDSCSNNTEYACVGHDAYSDSNCMNQYAIYCYTAGTGCSGGVTA